MLVGELAVPCSPQSAIAGVKCVLRLFLCGVCPEQVVLTIKSCAMSTCEPRQVLTEAALSKTVHVPRGRLV